jgi:hypothetical protein
LASQKLGAAEKEKICRLLDAGISASILAQRFQISPKLVRDVKKKSAEAASVVK